MLTRLPHVITLGPSKVLPFFKLYLIQIKADNLEKKRKVFKHAAQCV